MTLLEQLSDWDGLGTVVRYDRPTGAWMLIALHSNRLGRPTGGTRMKFYDSVEDGLRDAQRLAAGMTAKWAALALPVGGAKAVLALPRVLAGEERRGLLLRYGSLIESLNGSFATGEDLGTTPEDMAVVAEVSKWVHVFPDETGAPSDPGPYTAAAVLEGIRAALTEAMGCPDLTGRSVLVQGVGDVGLPLAESLAREGARVLVSDLDAQRGAEAARRTGGQVVASAAAYDTPCDVYAPCAVGATLNAATIPRLRCRVVAGSANNQLAEADDARRLHERGILYAPDYVINGGGALALGLLALGRARREELFDRMREIGDRLREIFNEARERGESPLAAAERRVQRTLENGLGRG